MPFKRRNPEHNRAAGACRTRLLSYLLDRYVPVYGKSLTRDALCLYANLVHSFLIKIGERDPADLALQTSKVKIDNDEGEEYSQEINSLMFALSNDEQFCCDKTSALSIYKAMLSVIKELSF